jgi:hypothetical protein
MRTSTILVPLLGLALLYGGYEAMGWPGVAFVIGGILMWVLIHFSRMMKVLERAADRPVGYCDSAVMLNAKLRKGVNMLHVMAMTRAVGEALSDQDVQPEIFRWTDGSASSVTCEFVNGRLVKWELSRPEGPAEAAPSPAP